MVTLCSKALSRSFPRIWTVPVVPVTDSSASSPVTVAAVVPDHGATRVNGVAGHSRTPVATVAGEVSVNVVDRVSCG